MAKTIVILLDGTSNEISANRTNILRLYGTLKKDRSQLVYYDPGVGTFGADNAFFGFWRKATEVLGLITGWGLDQNVLEAYRFLVENYQAGKGGDARDRIVLIGFSRGAYSARVLAGFIHAVGLMRRDQINLLPYAYRAYKRIGDGITDHGDDSFAEVRLFERILQTDRPPIMAMGLFDTVSSLIEWGRYRPQLRRHAFTKTNPSVAAVRHAMALHEARVMFRPQHWPEDQEFWGNPFTRNKAVPQDVKEVWFRGVHGDVGGGYPEAESALAKLPLAWMIREMEALGLRFIPQTVRSLVHGQGAGGKYTPPDPEGKIHQSMTVPWKPLEILPARTDPDYRKGRPSLGPLSIPFCRPRVVPEGAWIHESVIDNAAAQGRPLPPNVPADHRVERMTIASEAE